MTATELRDISCKLKVLNHAKAIGHVSRTCRYFGISRETFYQWRRAYERDGERALINSKPCPENPKLRIATTTRASCSPTSRRETSTAAPVKRCLT